MPGAAARLDVDPFDDDFLDDPYPFHEQIREAGAVVWLERYGIYASARHAEVTAGLSDWETFSSAAGVGLDDFRRAKPWRPPSLILEADPPLHTRSRTVLNRALSAKAMAGLRARFQDAAEKLADALVGRGEIDAIADIAEAYPLSVFPDAIGLGPEGLENLLPYGSMAFNAFGPRNKHFEASMRDAARVVGWINAQCAREALSPDGPRRDRLGGRRYRRDQRRGGAAAGALDADRGARHDDHRHRQRALCARRQPRRMAQAARKPGAGAPRLRRDAALRIAGADLLPHDDAARPNSAASSCRRTRKSCCFSPAPIAIRAAGRTRPLRRDAARPRATPRSAPAFTCASARCWRGWRPR